MINILVIDDDPDLNSLLSGFFLHKGMRVFTADSFAKGMEQSERKRIDVAIIDYQLGDGEGTDLLSHFQESHPETKLILMSGSTNPHLRDGAVALGASTFFSKPLDLNLLENWITRLTETED